MRKLSKIDESIWSDMQDRGTDDLLKKEESVNSLDIKRFTNYLKNRYSETATTKTTSSQIRLDKGKIYIPLLPYSYNAGYELVFNSKRLDFHDRYHGTGRFPSCLKFLKKNYVFTVFDSLGYSTIFTKLGNSVKTNEEVIEVIDMIIDNYQGEEELMISRKVSESIWSDMEERGTGDIIKKEDDLERLDVNDFCDYLNAKYKKQPKTISGSNTIKYDTETNQIGIPLLIWGSSDIFYVALIVDGYAKNIFISTNFASTNIPLMDLLEKNYDITVAKNPDNGAIKYVKVKPKNNEEVTNRFFVDLIDFILDNANDWTYVHIYERV